jgi:hypothetical protein
MLATSVAIPPLAISHWLRGWWRWRHAVPEAGAPMPQTDTASGPPPRLPAGPADAASRPGSADAASRPGSGLAGRSRPTGLPAPRAAEVAG